MPTSCTMATMTVPTLNITNATPPKLGESSPDTTSFGSPHKNQVPRLLYRGALSLPDSNLLLDGLTFTTRLPNDDPQASLRLLENPLPLALESMRGRPSLRFAGVEKMDNLYCDFSGGVNLHVHPRCILTFQLFAHHLCTTPITSPKGYTDYGVRIRLGDPDATNVPGSTTTTTVNDIVVFGRAHPSSSTLQLCVGRVLPAPRPDAIVPKAVSKLRPPRPDDPTPRKPPVGFAGMARIGLGVKRPLALESSNPAEPSKCTGRVNGDGIDGGSKKRAKKNVDAQDPTLSKKSSNEVLKDLGKNSRIGNKLEATFKIPPLPPSNREKAPVKGRSVPAEPDIFAFEPSDSSAMSEMESRNKAYMKKVIMRLMTAAGVGKQHVDFKEFFNHVYRGTIFALRTKMKTVDIESDSRESELLDRIAQAHVTIYLGGKGLGVYLLQ